MSLPAQGTIKDTEFIFYYRGTKETEERYRDKAVLLLAKSPKFSD